MKAFLRPCPAGHQSNRNPLEHHLTFRARATFKKFADTLFFLSALILPQLLTFCARWQSVFIPRLPSPRRGDVLHLRLRDPRRVSPYSSRGPDLIKIMRDELFDQDLLTTRRRLQATDKPRPCLPSSSLLFSRSDAPSFRLSWILLLLQRRC